MKYVNIKVSIAPWPRKKKTSLINIPLCPTTHGFFSDKQKSDARWAELVALFLRNKKNLRKGSPFQSIIKMSSWAKVLLRGRKAHNF